MRFSSLLGRTTPKLVASIALDGDKVRYGLVNGLGEPERGKLREARTWPATEASRWIGEDLDTYTTNERAEITAITGVVGDDVKHLLVTVPEDFADASEPQRQAYAIASTSWANDDTLSRIGLTVGMMRATPTSDTYVVAAAATKEVDAARDRVRVDTSRVRATTMAPALDALWRVAHPSDIGRPAPILVVLANDTYIDAIVVERGVPRAYAHETLAELIEDLVPRSVPTDAEDERIPIVDEDADAIDAEVESDETPDPSVPAGAPEGFVRGGYDSTSFAPSLKPRTEPRKRVHFGERDQIDLFQAAFRLALRRSIQLYTELESDAGVEAYATEIDLVYVTGAGVYSYEALTVARDYFGHQAEVRPLAAHAVTYVFGDPELAAHLGDHEAAYADVLALIALARRPDMLALEPFGRPVWADADASAPSAPPRGRTETTSSLARGALIFVVLLLLLTAPVVGLRQWMLAGQTAELAQANAEAKAREAKLAEEVAQRKRDRARIEDNEQNNKIIAEADARNAFQTERLDAVRAVVRSVNGAGTEARLEGMQVDTADGFSLTGTVANTDTANALVQALANHGNGAFFGMDLKTDTVTVKETLPSETDATKLEERDVERVRFTIRGRFKR